MDHDASAPSSEELHVDGLVSTPSMELLDILARIDAADGRVEEVR